MIPVQRYIFRDVTARTRGTWTRRLELESDLNKQRDFEPHTSHERRES